VFLPQAKNLPAGTFRWQTWTSKSLTIWRHPIVLASWRIRMEPHKHTLVVVEQQSQRRTPQRRRMRAWWTVRW